MRIQSRTGGCTPRAKCKAGLHLPDGDGRGAPRGAREGAGKRVGRLPRGLPKRVASKAPGVGGCLGVAALGLCVWRLARVLSGGVCGWGLVWVKSSKGTGAFCPQHGGWTLHELVS